MREHRFTRTSRTGLAACGLVLWACTGDPSADSERTRPAPNDFATTQIAEGVFQYRYGDYNSLFVVTSAGVVAFDPQSLEAASHYADEVTRVAPGAPLLAVVYSHHHADHATGADVLRDRLGPEAVIVAHENAAARIADRADPDIAVPTVTFSDRVSLYPGGEPIELRYLGPSHSDNMIVALLPERGVAFAVDFVAADRVAYQDFPGTVFPDLFDAVERLGDLEFETIVFGHGPPGNAMTIDRQIAYYTDLRAAVREAVDSGLTEDEAAERIDLPEFSDFGEYDAWFALNVRGLYRWMSGTEE